MRSLPFAQNTKAPKSMMGWDGDAEKGGMEMVKFSKQTRLKCLLAADMYNFIPVRVYYE